MATTVNLYEAKTQLSSLVERAAGGEEIVIAKAGKPKARLVAAEAPPSPRYKIGGWEGKVWTAEDFDDPLPDDLLDAFEGKGDKDPP
jgi:prevent-host-death family protein